MGEGSSWWEKDQEVTINNDAKLTGKHDTNSVRSAVFRDRERGLQKAMSEHILFLCSEKFRTSS